MTILLLHLFFYCFLFYNIYIFIFLNILYYIAYCVSKHIVDNKITETNNIFLKPFISANKSTTLYYIDIYLSKFPLYESIKSYYLNISKQFTEFADLALSATEDNTRKTVMTAMAPKPQDIMQMLPMLLAQKKNNAVKFDRKQAHIDMHSDVHLDLPMKPVDNPLLYDSDNDVKNDLSVD